MCQPTTAPLPPSNLRKSFRVLPGSRLREIQLTGLPHFLTNSALRESGWSRLWTTAPLQTRPISELHGRQQPSLRAHSISSAPLLPQGEALCRSPARFFCSRLAQLDSSASCVASCHCPGVNTKVTNQNTKVTRKKSP